MEVAAVTGGAAGPLAATGVAIRPAGAGDEVAGVRPCWVALPETAEEIAAVMRVSAEQDLAVVPVGGGTKLHWGTPPARCDVLIDTCCLDQVLEHAAGDLVVRAQAGVTVEALARTLATRGQELALDVPVPGSTIGGLLATGIAGPRRFRYGTARDLLIGITVVLADGTIARSGGKVVKNVAGYDLGKLFTGSYGTLGVIADATFRLHPLPTARAWVTVPVQRPVQRPVQPPPTGAAVRRPPAGAALQRSGREPGEPSVGGRRDLPDEAGVELAPALRALVPAVTRSPLEPSAVEVDWPKADGPCAVAVLVEGTAAAERAKALRELIESVLEGVPGAGAVQIGEDPPPWWGRLPEPPPAYPGGGQQTAAGETLVEIRTIPSRLPDSFVGPLRAASAAGVPAALRGSLAAPLLHVALPAGTAAGRVARFVEELRAWFRDEGTVVVLAAPEEVGPAVDRWGRVGALRLMRQVKERFDPDGRMSPGRFVGGI